MTSKDTKIEQLVELIKALPRHENGLPLKSAFNPMALPKLISGYLLAKVPAYGSQVVLISSEVINLDYGGSLKGVDLFDLMSTPEKAFFTKLHQTVFEQSCGVFTKRLLTKKSGIVISLNIHTFPMISNDGDEKFMLLYLQDKSETIAEKLDFDKFHSFNDYSEIQFLDLGNGIPEAKPYEEGFLGLNHL